MSRTIDSSFGKMPTTSARRLTSLLSRSNGLVELGLVLAGEGRVGEHVGFAVDDESGELRPAGAHHLGDMQQRPTGGCGVRLLERLAQRGGDHGVLALRHVGERIAGPVHPAALPGGAEDADDRRLQPFVGVGYHQLDAGEAAGLEALQEVRPEHLGLRRADVQTNDLAPAIDIDGDGDYRCDRDNPAGGADLQVGGIEPQVGPFASKGAGQEAIHPLVDVLALTEDLEMPVMPIA